MEINECFLFMFFSFKNRNSSDGKQAHWTSTQNIVKLTAARAFMRKEELNYLKAVYQDCISLRKQGELTEFGEGQLAICKILLNKKK